MAKRGPKQKHDWDALKAEWQRTPGVSKWAFLKAKGINPSSGNVQRKIKTWDQELAEDAETLTRNNLDRTKGKEQKEDIGSAYVEAEAEEVSKIIGRNVSDVSLEAQPKMWQLIQQWRSKQAVEDYKTADALRNAIKVILSDSIKKETKDGKSVFTTKLKPSEIRALSHATAEIQRVQRLALGLSTDNVGMQIDGDGRSDKDGAVETSKVDNDSVIPIFEVQINKNGKFVSHRPRRIR